MKVVNRQRWPISRGSQSKCNRRGSRSGVTWQHNRSTAELNISLEADGGVTLCNRFYPFDISNRASLRLPWRAPNSVPFSSDDSRDTRRHREIHACESTNVISTSGNFYRLIGISTIASRIFAAFVRNRQSLLNSTHLDLASDEISK